MGFNRNILKAFSSTASSTITGSSGNTGSHNCSAVQQCQKHCAVKGYSHPPEWSLDPKKVLHLALRLINICFPMRAGALNGKCSALKWIFSTLAVLKVLCYVSHLHTSGGSCHGEHYLHATNGLIVHLSHSEPFCSAH